MREYNYGVTGKDRKALVAAVSEILGTESKYHAAPNYEYTVGDYIVTRDGTLVGPEDISLIAWLAQKGFELETEAQPEAKPIPAAEIQLETEASTETAAESEEEAAGAEALPEPEPISEAATEPGTEALEPEPSATAAEPGGEAHETEAPPEPGIEAHETETALKPEGESPEAESTPEPVNTDSKTITPDFTANADTPDYLTIHYPLDGMSDEAISNLRKMVAAKAPLLKMALGVDELPILLTDDKNSISFPWFIGDIDSESVTGYAKFIACLCESAKRKKRVTAQTASTDNMRFLMRTWLVSLGMIGKEFDIPRKLLCAKLPGDSGHRFSDHDTTAAKNINPKARRAATPITLSEETRAQIRDIRGSGKVKMLNIHDIGELATISGYPELAELVQTDPISYVSFILSNGQ